MFKLSRFQSRSKTSGRIFAIGDVHGCARELEALLKKLSLRHDDLVVFLGDLVDRGPDSKRVIDLVLDLRAQQDAGKVVALKGNHEAMFIDFLERPESPGAGVFILNGGDATLASYAGLGGSFEIPETHIQFLNSMPVFFATDDYFFVHAGVPDLPLAKIDVKEHEKVMLWIRDPFHRSNYKWEKLVVHGHTPVPDPEVKRNRINIDTGCVYDGYLTALELPAMKFHQVEKGIKREPVLYPRELHESQGAHRVAMRFSGRLPVTAARAGEAPMFFETLNYNQLGLLLRDASLPGVGSAQQQPVLRLDDVIEGQIGENKENAILFSGTVVRVEHRGAYPCYGVRIDRITNGDDGRQWIERPS